MMNYLYIEDFIDFYVFTNIIKLYIYIYIYIKLKKISKLKLFLAILMYRLIVNFSYLNKIVKK